MEQAAAENDVEARIAKIQADHDARVASLIEANNQLVQNVRDERARRIEAEKWSEQLKSHLMAKYEELGDLEADALADAVRTPAGAALSAGWYWADRGLGHHAEVGNFGEVARLVAGAATVATTIGIDRRMERWRAACAILGAQP